MNEKIKFTDMDTNEEVEFSVVEETRVNNVNYLLVTEEDDNDDEEEQTAYILKDMSSEDSVDAKYVIVEDDKELEYVSKIFEELLDDIDLE